jgi:hypothetical protein
MSGRRFGARFFGNAGDCQTHPSPKAGKRSFPERPLLGRILAVPPLVLPLRVVPALEGLHAAVRRLAD